MANFKCFFFATLSVSTDRKMLPAKVVGLLGAVLSKYMVQPPRSVI